MVVAIDGPSGVGKSTVARAVAHEMNMDYLDTGSTYRAATLAVIRAGIDQSSESLVLDELAEHHIDYTERGIQLDGESVTDLVRSDDVTAGVSTVAAHSRVRKEIVGIQRRWVRDHGNNAVVEGRDIGTVVFPTAPVKIYLTANPTVRATRRLGDAESSGKSVEEIAAEIEARDKKDSTRKASPLRPATDATVIDTSTLTIDEVVTQIITLVTAATTP